MSKYTCLGINITSNITTKRVWMTPNYVMVLRENIEKITGYYL